MGGDHSVSSFERTLRSIPYLRGEAAAATRRAFPTPQPSSAATWVQFLPAERR